MYGLPTLSVKNPSSLWRNPLAFPAGRAPGFDPSHPAAINCLGSIVTFKGVPASIFPFAAATKHGTPASVIDGALGPSVQPATTNNNNANGYTFPATVPASSFTVACAFRALSISGGNSAYLITASAASNSQGLLIANSTGIVNIRYNSSSNLTTGLSIVANTPYFIAASVLSGSAWAIVILNLTTGALQTANSSSGAGVVTSSTGLALGYAAGTAALGLGGNISVAMYSATWLSLQKLMAWAADPWAFWYPDTLQFDYGLAGTILNLSILGQSLANSQGSLVANSNLPLVGQSETISKGTLALNSNLLVTGQGLVNSQGQLIANSNLAIAGQSLTETQGSVGISRATALLGSSVTLTPGAVTPAVSVGILGQSLSSSVGSVGLVKSLALVGQSVINSVGNLGVSKTLSLIGLSIGTFIGNLIAQILVPLFPSKDRTLSVQAENRGLIIEPENRTFGIDE